MAKSFRQITNDGEQKNWILRSTNASTFGYTDSITVQVIRQVHMYTNKGQQSETNDMIAFRLRKFQQSSIAQW